MFWAQHLRFACNPVLSVLAVKLTVPGNSPSSIVSYVNSNQKQMCFLQKDFNSILVVSSKFKTRTAQKFTNN